MGRFWIEAMIVGVCVGLAAIGLQIWLVGVGPLLRWAALAGAGVLLCVLQYGLARRGS